MTTDIISIFRAPLRRLHRDQGGVSAIEFGLLMPILLFTGLSGLEYTNYILARQKIERVTTSTADLFARYQVPPNENQVNDLFLGVDDISKPFNVSTKGRVIVSGVIGTYDTGDKETQNKIAWQRCHGNYRAQSSRFGSAWSGSNYADGPEIDLPNGIALEQSQMAILVEVFYEYDDTLTGADLGPITRDHVFGETSVFRTRASAYTGITPVSGATAQLCS